MGIVLLTLFEEFTDNVFTQFPGVEQDVEAQNLLLDVFCSQRLSQKWRFSLFGAVGESSLSINGIVHCNKHIVVRYNGDCRKFAGSH